MAYIIRDGDIVPVAIPVGRRIKIGINYQRPIENYISNDQLWIQDVFTFNHIPWYAIKYRAEKWIFYAALWGSIVYVLSFIGRHYI